MSSRARDEGPSKRLPSEPEDGGEKPVEPTPPDANQAKDIRSMARRKGIRSTETLVRAYNAATDTTERGILLKWLTQYNDILARDEGKISREVLFEYGELANIKPRTDDDESLLKTLTLCFGKRIPRGEFPHTDLAQALHRVLLWIYPGAFKDRSPLVFLVDKLMDSLSPTPMLTKENFAEHEAIFLALHQSIVLLQRVARRKVAGEEKTRFRRAFMTKRREMQGSLKYYPVRFHLKLIEQGIERLELDESRSSLGAVMNCMAGSFCGILHMFHGLRAIATVDIDPAALEEGFKRIQEALRNLGVPQRQWYDLTVSFTLARVQTVQDPGKLPMFETGFDVMIEAQAKMRRSDDHKAMRFEIVNELRELAVHGVARDGRFWAMDKLLDSGARLVSNEGWTKDAEVFEALLDAVHCVHARGESVDATSKALRELVALESAGAKLAAKEWLGNETIEDKLCVTNAERTEGKSTWLFRTTGKAYGVVPTDQALANIEDMRSRYQDEAFAKVRSLFDNEQPTHVKDMRYEIVAYERRESKEPREQRRVDEEKSGAIDEDHASMYHGRKQRVTISIAIDDLFKPRKTTPDRQSVHVNTVLLFGDPGTGKTCISKTIAHGWAAKTSMREFKCVFLLPVRELNGSKYKDHANNSHGPLEAAVGDLCFSHRSGEEYEHLLTQISDELDEETTLLVLDGLDEGDQSAKNIVEQGKKRSCKLLLLSRPYNIQAERAFVDIEVECVGLGGTLLRRYIIGELPESGERLMHFLKSNPSLTEVARVPITAHILCSLWKTEEKKMMDGMTETSLSTLYSEMVTFVWERYLCRPGMKQAYRGEVFGALEAIALEGFEEGQILIEQKLVAKHCEAPHLKAILKDSGFLLLRIEGAEYQFPHLTFQEFFAGRCLATLMRGGDEEAKTRAMNLVTEMKYFEKNKVMLSFMAAEMSARQGLSGYGIVLTAIDREPIEIIGVQHLFLKLRMLNGFLSVNKSVIKEAAKDEQVLHLVDSLVKMLRCCDIGSGLWEIAINRIKEIPIVIRNFPKILDVLVEGERLKRWIRYDIDEIASIVRHGRRHWESLFGVILTGSTDEHWVVRMKAMKAIGRLAEAAPDKAGELTEALARGSTDEHWIVRREAVKAVGRLAEAAPDKARELAEALARESTDKHTRLSSEELRRLAKELREPAEKFARGSMAEEWRVGGKAMNAIGRLAEALARESTDKHTRLSSEELRRLAKKLREPAEKFARGSMAEEWRVGGKAMNAIGRLAEAAPYKAGELAEALARGSTDEDKDVRENAMEAIGRLTEAAPDKAGELAEALARGSMDESEDVRQAARRSRDALSLHLMFRSLELSHHHSIAHEIGRRLMEAASTLVSSANNKDLQLVSHLTSLNVVYTVPEGKMLAIIEAVKDALNGKFPGLLAILWGIKKTS